MAEIRTTEPRPSIDDIRRIAPIACVLLVTLRLFIGWQFLYEGLWKYNTLGTSEEWSAEGYLGNAQGPFRDHFRGMTGDPDELSWLDYEAISDRWDRFGMRMIEHYDLDEAQQRQLWELVDGADSFSAPLAKMPRGVTWATDPKVTGTARQVQSLVKWDGRQLVVSGEEPLKPSEIDWLKKRVPLTQRPDGRYARVIDPTKPAEGDNLRVDADPRKVGAPAEEVAYVRAIERLEALIRRDLGYKRRAKASLMGDPDRIGVTAILDADRRRYEPEMGTTPRPEESIERDSIRYGEIQVYKDLLEEHRDALAGPDVDYRETHAGKIWEKVQEKKAELVGPIKAMDAELRAAATKMLTPQQLARGGLPPRMTQLRASSMQAMIGLLVLGTLLLLGLLTRVAALGGAVMLTLFYLVWPPWPGVPDAPGPDHAFIVNKNLIEVVALLAIAAMPTGTWFGIDGIFYRLWRRRRAEKVVAEA